MSLSYGQTMALKRIKSNIYIYVKFSLPFYRNHELIMIILNTKFLKAGNIFATQMSCILLLILITHNIFLLYVTQRTTGGSNLAVYFIWDAGWRWNINVSYIYLFFRKMFLSVSHVPFFKHYQQWHGQLKTKGFSTWYKSLKTLFF